MPPCLALSAALLLALAALPLPALAAASFNGYPIAVSFFASQEAHATAVLDNETSIVCTGTATSGTCNMLIVAPGRQALAGPALNITTTDTFVSTAMTRLSSTSALLCYTTISSGGSCAIISANAYGVLLGSNYLSFCQKQCFDLQISAPINNTGNVVFCYTTQATQKMTCDTLSTKPSLAVISSIQVGMGSWGAPSLALLPDSNVFLCYADAYVPVTSTDIPVPLLSYNSRGVCQELTLYPNFTLALNGDPLMLTTSELTEKVAMDVVGTDAISERALVCFVANREDALCMGIFLYPFPYIASTVELGPGFGVGQMRVTALNAVTGLFMVCYQEIMQDALSCVSVSMGMDGTVTVSDNMVSMTDQGALLANIPSALSSITANASAIVATPVFLTATTGPMVGQFVNQVLVLPILQSVIGSSDSSLVSLACVTINIDELSTRRFCLGSPTQIALAQSTPAPTLPTTTYCNVALEWQCQAKANFCDWIPSYGCQPKSFCGATNSIECAMLKTTYLHPCSWSNSKCIMTGSTLPLSQLCPAIKSQSSCPLTIGCAWFPYPIGCQAMPYCTLPTAKQCSASPGCLWVPTVGTAGVCGISP